MYTAYLRYDATLMTLGLPGWIFWYLLCLSASACLLRYNIFFYYTATGYLRSTYATSLLCSGSGLAAPPREVLHMIYYNTYMQYDAMRYDMMRYDAARAIHG